MHLRRTTALVAGALLVASLSGCANVRGKVSATNRVYTPAVGTNNREASVDVLGAVVVSAQPGSGTFIATLVNNNEEEANSLDSVAGTGHAPGIAASESSGVGVPARGYVNLADGEGVVVTGEFEAGNFVEVQLGLGDGETVIMQIPVVPDAGSFLGLDSSSA
jgi:hypothetical protein